MISLDQLKFNIDTVNANIDKALQSAGRSRDSLTVVAATKTQPIERIRECLALSGIQIAGENRAQEFQEKYDQSINWQIIGQLQTNKAKYVVGKVSLIQSVDRESLLAEIDRLSEKRQIVSDILLEINIAGEEAKGGLPPEQVADFLDLAKKYKNVCVKGIMSVMPNEKNVAKLGGYYLQLSKIYDNISKICVANADIKYLSAGMSGDYQIAIENGANMIRLGSALFGARY